MVNQILETLLSMDKKKPMPKGVDMVVYVVNNKNYFKGYAVAFRNPVDVDVLRKIIKDTLPIENPNGFQLSYELEDNDQPDGQKQLLVYKVEKRGATTIRSVYKERYILGEIKMGLRGIFYPRMPCIFITDFDNPIEMNSPNELLCNFLEEYRKERYEKSLL